MKSRRSSAVSNAGPLIHLSRAGLLHLLKQLYGQVLVPEAVKVEVVKRGKRMGFADALQVENALSEGWIRVEETEIPKEFASTADTAGLDRAEAAVIHHAYRAGITALLDDEAARLFARTLGVEVRGSIGVILEALKRRLTTPREALEGLEKLSEVMYLSMNTYRLARREIERMSAAGQ